MTKIIYINKGIENKIRIDKFLYNYFKKKISRKKIQIFINKKYILLNNKTIKKNKKLKINDKITIINNLKNIKEDNKKLSNINLNVKIHYEDNNVIVINKKPGQIVHHGYGNYNNTLIDWLKIKYKDIKNELSNYRYGLLHRLDKNTSGLLIIAKNIYTFKYINYQFLNQKIKKKYLALIWGIPKKKKSIIKNYIGRNKKKRIKMMVLNDKKYGKYSITKYKILKTFKILSLIKCKLKTGRTYQIRVHLNYIGHPIFNDNLYGGNKITNRYKYINKYKNSIKNLFKILPRHALHAYYLSYKDPISKKYKILISKLPKDITNAIKYLNKII